MSTINDGGYVFPQSEYVQVGDRQVATMKGGECLRDAFAGLILPKVMEIMNAIQGIGSSTFPSNCAVHAYRIADAMIAARTAK